MTPERGQVLTLLDNHRYPDLSIGEKCVYLGNLSNYLWLVRIPRIGEELVLLSSRFTLPLLRIEETKRIMELNGNKP